MALEKIRRIVFIVAAVVLFFATVLPNMGVNVGMADMSSGITAVSNSMTCADCTMDTMKFGSASCAQGSCIGLAVIAEPNLNLGPSHKIFFRLATIRPDELSFAPPTPPI